MTLRHQSATPMPQRRPVSSLGIYAHGPRNVAIFATNAETFCAPSASVHIYMGRSRRPTGHQLHQPAIDKSARLRAPDPAVYMIGACRRFRLQSPNPTFRLCTLAQIGSLIVLTSGPSRTASVALHHPFAPSASKDDAESRTNRNKMVTGTHELGNNYLAVCHCSLTVMCC